jgi:hypothetical protein
LPITGTYIRLVGQRALHELSMLAQQTNIVCASLKLTNPLLRVEVPLDTALHNIGQHVSITNAGQELVHDISISLSDELVGKLELSTYKIASLLPLQNEAILVKPSQSSGTQDILRNYTGAIYVNSKNGGNAEVKVQLEWIYKTPADFRIYHRGDDKSKKMIETIVSMIEAIHHKVTKALGNPLKSETTTCIFSSKREMTLSLQMAGIKVPTDVEAGYDSRNDMLFIHTDSNVVEVAHEFTHRVIAHYKHPWSIVVREVPDWLNEGVADYGAYIATDRTIASALKLHLDAFHDNPIRPSQIGWQDWSGWPEGSNNRYGASFSFILFIDANYGGPNTIKRVLEGMGDPFFHVDDWWLMPGIVTNAVGHGNNIVALENEWWEKRHTFT